MLKVMQQYFKGFILLNYTPDVCFINLKLLLYVFRYAVTFKVSGRLTVSHS